MLTRSPAASAPSELRRSVSSMTSAVTASPSTFAAVRHTPLTATESPAAVSRNSGSAIVMRAEASVDSTLRTVARLSTMPVNIGSAPLSAQHRVDAHIGADLTHGLDLKPHSLGDRRHTSRVEYRWA